MRYDPPRPAGRLLLTPEDKEAPARTRRLRVLGLGEHPEPSLDAFARRLAELAGAPYALVNFIGEERQFFAGLHTRPGSGAGADPARPAVGVAPAEPAGAGGTTGAVGVANGTVGAAFGTGRRMARDYGFCPHVVVRRKALVLEDVRDYPRFAGNPVVDEFGIRSYLGAPLIDRTGIALGTVCVTDVEPRPWGRSGLDTIKAMAAELVEQIELREGGF
ncbi:GAF domain-containing protein [Streptomyces sp. Qhu-G9]|uniref:GAF domain-containing protein n=1 Tax=Streptomyces sp. Qhu-G9 TaxID=3452799 RepID=UPI0022AC2D53|nr:GAF domain-containing protein [Streptomyces aurantiacus]WAU83801.1 GAF domain-containing protein [Streptomyces aurantiacus]